jgi:hypothetical protein
MFNESFCAEWLSDRQAESNARIADFRLEMARRSYRSRPTGDSFHHIRGFVLYARHARHVRTRRQFHVENTRIGPAMA